MTAPLSTLSTAVVGVIVSLSVFFDQHVFLQAGHVDIAAIALLAAACVALFRYRIGAIPVILACAVAGLVLSCRHG